MDLTVQQIPNREYAVASRTFEISELKMMMDAVHRAITAMLRSALGQ